MNRLRKILILYASYGDGHLQVSRALADAFRRAGADQVKLVDLYAETSPVFNRLVKFIYIKSYTFFPSLYGLSYYATRKMKYNTAFSGLLNRFGVSRLRRLLMEEGPDLVVSTFPMQAMAESRRLYGERIPCFTVVTDFDLHGRWVHPETDKFYVATPELKNGISALGIPNKRIRVTGIPLKRAFREQPDTALARAKFGLDPDKNTVLIMAGSYGVMPDLSRLCAKLSALGNLQLAVVCGNNERLRAEMQQTFEGDACVKVFGFVHEIHELMALASCMVTKPGGVTLAEGLAARLPVILFRPVPGQERENARYLASKGAALIALSTAGLADQIRKLMHDDGLRDTMREAAARLSRPDAADAVTADILREMASHTGRGDDKTRRTTARRRTKNRPVPVKWWAGFLKLFQNG